MQSKDAPISGVASGKADKEDVRESSSSGAPTKSAPTVEKAAAVSAPPPTSTPAPAPKPTFTSTPAAPAPKPTFTSTPAPTPVTPYSSPKTEPPSSESASSKSPATVAPNADAFAPPKAEGTWTQGSLPPEEVKEFERVAKESEKSEEVARRAEAEPVFADIAPPVAPNQYLRPGVGTMYVVMVTPELSPVAKIGGLADVVFGLSRELEIRGNSVEIILPKYDCLRWNHIWGLTPVFNDLWVPWFDGAIHCTVYFGFVHGRKCFFIEPHSRDRFFERGKVYGDGDDVMRFAFFSRAAMEFMLKSGKQPDIIHCHDWQTALVPVLLYEIYQRVGMWRPRVCFTIHNFKHQGNYDGKLLRATGLNRPEYYYHPDRLGVVGQKDLNLLKGGIVYSNFVNTVSPTYAGEAKDRGGAFGLEGTLYTHHVKYGGILNGVDYEVWNPETDTHIPAQYSTATIERKYDNKRALRQRLLLADNEKPIVAFVGRLDAQKGLDLVRHSLFYCVNHGAQFVLLGSGSERVIDDHFKRIKWEINNNPDSHLEIGFDEELSHLIYAGADMMIVPSRFEPCGLTQLIAIRYGTIPIVRSVGGLADTVFDKDHSNRPLHERNGYVFHNDDDLGIESGLTRAISCYYMFPDHFRQLMLNSMRSDYSWNVPGQHYLNVYDYIRAK